GLSAVPALRSREPFQQPQVLRNCGGDEGRGIHSVLPRPLSRVCHFTGLRRKNTAFLLQRSERLSYLAADDAQPHCYGLFLHGGRGILRKDGGARSLPQPL